MLRLLLLTALVAVAASHKGHHGHGHLHGLRRLLGAGHVGSSLGLVTRRYPGISQLGAAQLIRQSLVSPVRSYLSHIKYRSVPSLASGLRSRYLRSYFGGFPSSPFYGSYISPLTSYLGKMGVRVRRRRLLDSLALTDYYLSSYRVAPISSSLFNRFYSSHLLGLKAPVTRYTFPRLSSFLPRFQQFRFPGSYFRSIAVAPSSLAYSGPGSAFLSVYSSLGLPYPVYPAATLGGLNSFLTSQRISFPQFVSSIRGSSSLAGLVRSVQLRPYRRYYSRLPFLTDSVLLRDVLPVFGSRFVSYPSNVRSNLYLGKRHASFAQLVGGFFGSSYFSGLHGNYNAYNPGFVSAFLSGFDTYCAHGRLNRLKNYKGPYWRGGLRRYLKGHKQG